MKKLITFGVLVTAFCFALAGPSHAQRTDAVWARSTNGAPITLDGQLNEPAWAVAESTVISYAVDAGVPGSGWKSEGGVAPSDPSRTVLKFLTVGNQLYMGAFVYDKSIGGSEEFNRFDGLLMDLSNHTSTGAPKPSSEYLYSWWYPGQIGTPPVGQMPAFKGLWAEEPVGSPRTPAQIAAWDAVTTVFGTSNSDATNDLGYQIEMRFDLGVMGYNVTQPAGDIMEWNVSVYDCDWLWPINATTFSSNRVWWQDPWGNTGWYGEVRIHAKPSVTIASGPLPVIEPELILPRAGALAAPVVDGNLNDPVWAQSPFFDIRYGDDALRASYPNVAKHRSGQYQPPIDTVRAEVVDPGNCRVKYIVKDDWLYFAFDVSDQFVNYNVNPDRWDGLGVILTEKVFRGPDRSLLNRMLSFQVSPTGDGLAQGYLPYLRDSLSGAQLALALKPGTNINTNNTPDTGWNAELGIDLKKLGYAPGLGDGVVHLGMDFYDGDNLPVAEDSYSTRTWWMRERENVCCPIWAYADPTAVVAVGDPPTPGGAYAILGASPDPVRSSATVRIQLAQASRVLLETYDVAGRRQMTQNLGIHPAGVGQVVVPRSGGTGLVLYRLLVRDPETGEERATLSGKLTFVQ
jgi:hypothetical protein